MKSEREILQQCELICRIFDGSLDPEELRAFEYRLSQDPELLDIYTQVAEICGYLICPGTSQGLTQQTEMSEDAVLSNELWQQLAEHEKGSPEIKILQEQPEQEFIQTVVHTAKEKRKISKFNIVFLALNTAAILFLVLFIKLVPSKQSLEVANLSDSINAKWADMDSAMEQGTPIFTSREKLFLREGYAKLLFDNQTQVTIEGPAEFQVLAEDRIGLQYGKIYAIVPQEAIGFTVTTQMAKVIDLGTEFGVESDAYGDTYLHVIKGKTTLIGGQNSNKVSMDVGKGYAKKVSAQTSVISDIPCNTTLFVRSINSQTNFVWKGQNVFNLADIVGGGNGFGTGKVDMGIDPISGKSSKESWETRKSANDYHPVPSNPYIDGVFVPNGRTPQIVSSQGHLFRECPVTCGLCNDNIRNVEKPLEWIVSNMKVPDSPAISILMHANMGITFDLEAMRKLLPGVNIARFQSIIGIRRWATRPDASNADFWVLIDGKARYIKKQVKINEPYSVDIELSEQDRFLTLIETDGGDPEDRIIDGSVVSPIDSDWGMFDDPVLILK